MRHVLDGVHARVRRPGAATSTPSSPGPASPASSASGGRLLLPPTRRNTVLGEATALERGRLYQGGEPARAGASCGPRRRPGALRGRPHLRRHPPLAGRARCWRTALVVEELERELDWLDGHREALGELARLEGLRTQLEDAVASHRTALNQAERRRERAPRTARRPRWRSRPGASGTSWTSCAARCASRERIAELARALDAGRQRHLGLPLQGGERELALRRAGGGLRLPLHQPGLQLRLLLADGAVPLAARRHAARAGHGGPLHLGRGARPGRRRGAPIEGADLNGAWTAA